jgi:heme oxygenase
MQADCGSPEMPDVLTLLREATGPSHERLDAAFGSLDLSKRADLAGFLSAHAIGLEPLFPAFRAFVEDELGLECPDYPAMLRADLDALGVGALPSIAARPGIGDEAGRAGVAYVVSGSRLGLVVIRQRGYWGEAQGFRSAYMSDGRGHEAWKALVPVLRSRTRPGMDVDAVRTAALAAFDTFADAFATGAGVKAPANG